MILISDFWHPFIWRYGLDKQEKNWTSFRAPTLLALSRTVPCEYPLSALASV